MEDLGGYRGLSDRAKCRISLMQVDGYVENYFYNTYHLDKTSVIRLLDKHRAFGTLIYIPGKGMARFNVNNDVAHVLDIVVWDGGIRTIRELVYTGRLKFPLVKYLRFERALKKKSNTRIILIDKFLKGGI